MRDDPRDLVLLGRTFHLELPQHSSCDAKGFYSCRNAAIDADLDERVLQLLATDPVADSSPDVLRKLLWPVERRQHTEIHKTAISPTERGAPPTGAPAELGYKLLKLSVERIGLIESSPNSLFSKHFRADSASHGIAVVHVNPLFQFAYRRAPVFREGP